MVGNERTARVLVAAAAGMLAISALAACGDDDTAAQAGQLDPIAVTQPPSTGTASPPPAAGTPSGTQSNGTVVDTRAELEVEDQRGDGSGVRVDFVRLTSGSGHVAIRTRDGQFLGSAPVTSSSQPVTIPLSPTVSSSGELYAVLYADDGDGDFDPDVDPIVVDDDGEREIEDFDYRVDG